MDSLPNHFLTFIISSIVASIVPGVAVMGAFTVSLQYGFKRGFIFSLGLITASLIYFWLSAIGLISLFEKSAFLFEIIKYAGIAYLLYLGVQSYRSQSTISNQEQKFKSNNLSIYISGLMVNLANPKNILFFIVVLPQYINTSKPINAQMMWLATGSAIPEFIILLAYALFAKKLKVHLEKNSTALFFNKVIGILFIGLAVSMLFLF